MAVESNEASSSAIGAKHRSAISGVRGLRFQYLKTTTCRSPADYQLPSIDRAMELAGIQPISNRQGRGSAFIAKAASRLRLTRNILRPAGPVFVNFMGFSESKIFPFSCWSEIIPYCFDCWPSRYGRWLSFFKRQRVRIAFFSARQSAQYFSEAHPSMHSIWLPEATDPAEYRHSKSFKDRDIDVLELGRKYDRFHSRIFEPLAKADRSHLFERVKGKIIFPEKDGLIDGYARSKISICFPASQTHPDWSGPVETVTHRYFQSMASKCLIVGHAPQELTDLFGYNPVIEVQEGHESEQILSLLNNMDSFRELVDKNYDRLMEVGTWNSRVTTIIDTLCDFPVLS